MVLHSFSTCASQILVLERWGLEEMGVCPIEPLLPRSISYATTYYLIVSPARNTKQNVIMGHVIRHTQRQISICNIVPGEGGGVNLRKLNKRKGNEWIMNGEIVAKNDAVEVILFILQ